MDKEKKAEISYYVGCIVFFVSCIGRNSYNESIHDVEDNCQVKVPFETIFVSSIITAVVFAIGSWLLLTIYDCYTRKKKEGIGFWKAFKEEVFCKKTLLTLFVITAASVLMAFIGILLIGLAIFLIPLLKGKFK